MTAAPSMAEVLAKHATVATGLGEWCCKCSPREWRATAHRAAHVAQALAAAGFGHVASVEAERWAATVAAVTPCACSAQRARAEAAEAQVADLKRWKNEALPVMSGLQELGHALDLPLGERITGERALEAVQALVSQVAAVRALLDGSPMIPQAMVRRALDGEGGR